MRIFDRIASGEGVHDAIDWWDATSMSWIRKAANTYPRFVVDEASQYFQMHGRREWTQSQLGDSHPPFDDCWVEWKTPDQRRRGKRVEEWASAEFAVVLSKYEGRHRGLPFVTQGRGTPILMLPLYLDINEDLGLDWSTIDRTKQQFIEMVPRTATGEDILAWAYDLLPMLLAFGWMNTRELGPELVRVSPRLNKRRVERNQTPFMDYYKVSVRPQYRQRFEADGGLGARRFHLVRGHFMTFTKPSGGHENGFVGTTWRRGHAKGNKSLGTINKEYHVTAEAAQ